MHTRHQNNFGSLIVYLYPAKFAINANTGIVTVLGDLDTENRSQYQIRVQAREDLGALATTSDVVR